MAIEFADKCTEFLHSYVPIVEGGQTVGLFCPRCKKTVREDMSASNVVVTDKEIFNLPSGPDKTLVWYFKYVNKNGKKKNGSVAAHSRMEAQQRIAAVYGSVMNWDEGIIDLRSIEWGTQEYKPRHRKDPRF